MGSKVDDITNKNMLSQEAGNFSYLVDGNGNEQVLNASIMTWDNSWVYMRKNGMGILDTEEPLERRIWR